MLSLHAFNKLPSFALPFSVLSVILSMTLVVDDIIVPVEDKRAI